jgi:phosphatidyl-myo-inositol dimannoside synthase
MFVISTRNFPPDVGGIQNLMEGLSKALLEHGPVKIFADVYANSDNYDQNSGLQIDRVSGLKIFRKYRKANLVKDFVKNNEVRAVFFDHWKSIENIDMNILARTKSFCLIHSKEINHPINSFINKRMIKAIKKASFVIANSDFTKNLAINRGVDKEKIKIINPGCNYPIKTDVESKNSAKEIFGDSFPKIITIARLDKRKSHQNILMTIKNLIPKFPNIKYVSIGDGDEKENLKRLKKELDFENEVVFIDKSSEQLKTALLEESDLFLMPSIVSKKSVEGFGISYIEAASYGKCSIGGISGGEADAIKNGITGYLCDGENLNSIYENLLKSFENDSYKILGKNAFEFSKNFKWKKIIKKYLELI